MSEAAQENPDDADLCTQLFPVTYWCALSGVCVYDPVPLFAGGRPADAAVEYVRRTLREGWEARPYVRRLSGTFTVRVLGEGPAGVGAQTPADVKVEWAARFGAGSDVTCAVFAQAVPS